MNAYTWDELHVGTSAELETVVTEAMMARFCADTGDENPLHTDGAHARRLGFDDRVVYGLLTASFFSTLAGVHLPGKHCLLMGVAVDFNKPVYIGDRLSIRGEVSYRNEALKQAELKCAITNQRGQLVSRGKLKVGVRQP